ncbi:TonB-dependent receptor [Roseateles saccharophilus]|uniref:TonB-dependent receptor n=1 Tax=Roseateles saccharophilus TaxID=304 RepID=A0A4R3VJE0_ROSSA|nr:TonB-dependent receptor [Roseateles saccharophilus]MDG0835460.1 TonB-dependent receptor [Roseateles saccharophilus]TCV04012.1 TonB-dependent receptor [Roseateles saccharophilus]
MNKHRRTAISLAAAQAALLCTGVAWGQAAPAPASAASAAEAKPQKIETVIVSGQRAALQSAQKIKQNSDEVVDSIVADDIGKLPDKSVTEVLQRIAGVSIDRTLNRADPQQGVGDGVMHFAAEGTGVSVRGLSYVRSELNGRDSFSANGGRSLSFEDVPPELMAGVDVYKNPSAEQVEGAIGGLVNLRTALPFDFKGFKGAFSAETSRQQLRGGKAEPSFSGLVSNRWKTDLGEIGALLDIAHSKIATRANGVFVEPYYPRTDALIGDTSGKLRWISKGGSWSASDFDRTRDGLYGALQWRKNDVSSSLTYFRSKYKMDTRENGMSVGGTNTQITLDPGATFDANDALLTGTLRAPGDGAPGGAIHGLGFATLSRHAGRTADTRDIAWNITAKVSPSLTLRSDLQHIKAISDGTDYLIGTGGWMPKQQVDFTTSTPSFNFDAADRAFLADASNYYWGSAQEHRDHATASETAWRVDGKLNFDDAVLNDLRFGFRLTHRGAITQSTHDSEWAQITQPWAVGKDGWQPFSQLAWMSDPRFKGDTHIQPFNNFFNGKGPMPAPIVVPDMNLLNDAGFKKVHGYADLVCQVSPCWAHWNPAQYGDDKGRNEQNERTQAVYGQLRFSFDDLAYPVDGNVGVRAVYTQADAVGNTILTVPNYQQNPGVPVLEPKAELQTFHNAYSSVLPSLNLRMKANDKLQYRMALSKGVSRPDLYQMQAYTTISQTVQTHQDASGHTVVDSISYTGSARGNPMLKPVKSNNLDLTAEYYFGPTSSFTVAVFDKQLRDVVIGQTGYYRVSDTSGQPHDFAITAPVNGAKGKTRGIEVGYQQYFDKLPGWLSGFGVSGNVTLIDSTMTMYDKINLEWCTPRGTVETELARNLYGCDTNGHVIGNLPLPGMSRRAFNLALLYDYGPLSARIAYSWRSKYLQAANAFGTNDDFGNGWDYNPNSPNYKKPFSSNFSLPTWGGAYGQVDMGVHYKVNDDLGVSFEAQNLNDALYKQYMQQGIGLMQRSAFYTGRRYTVQMRYSF